MTFLEINHLIKRYGAGASAQLAINDLSFKVAPGEFVGVMGPSGAGKSTLLKLIAGFLTPTAGSIKYAGSELTTMNDRVISAFRKQQLGFIFQDFNLLPELSVADNISLPLRLQATVPTDLNQQVAGWAQRFGLGDLLTRYPDQLSGGQKQRVAAARALVTNPALVLADEPTGSLDSQAATTMLQTFQQLNQSRQTSILMVTHDAFMASFASRIIFIKDGAYFAEVTRKANRQQFYADIMNMAATINGGGWHDVVTRTHTTEN